VLGGTRGSGKTELLSEIKSRSRNLPHAWFDFEASPQAEVRDVLISLWSELGARRRQFGRIRFPRLLLGLLVRENQLRVRDPVRARADVERLVRSHPLVLGTGSSAGRTPEQLSVDLRVGLPGTASVGIANLQRVLPWAMSRARLRIHIAPALAWYRDGDEADGYDALVRLMGASGGEADRVLCEAFLADLAAAYSRDSLASHRTLKCLVLLDNVHHEAGARFLDLLLQARQAVADEVPLVVVAATRQPDRHFVPEESVRLSLADWERRGEGLPDDRRSRYGIRLRGLGRKEIAARLPRVPDPGPRLVRLLHCLTRGHPATVSLLVGALERHRAAHGGIELRHTLDLPSGSRDGRAPAAGGNGSVGQAALRHILYGVHPRFLDRLITWSAALDVSQMVRMDGLFTPGAVDTRHLTDGMAGWTEGAGRGAVLNPLLRRLLLYALSTRPADHPRSWDEVNRLLRQDYEDRLEDPGTEPRHLDELRTGVHYHQLALGNIRPVVQHLRATLVASDVGPWLDQLAAIAAAPCRPFSGEAIDRVAELVLGAFSPGDDGVDQAIATLVACRWIAGDPLGDPEFTLLPVIQQQYRLLADAVVTRLAKPAFIVLYQEAQAWQMEAWEDRCL